MGVTEQFIQAKAMGGSTSAKNKEQELAAIRLFFNFQLFSHLSSFFAVALQELIRETPKQDVANRFDIERDRLSNLMQNAASFAVMVVQFCRYSEWWDLELLLSGYLKRINVGVKPDIVPLTGKFTKLLF